MLSSLRSVNFSMLGDMLYIGDGLFACIYSICLEILNLYPIDQVILVLNALKYFVVDALLSIMRPLTDIYLLFNCVRINYLVI